MRTLAPDQPPNNEGGKQVNQNRSVDPLEFLLFTRYQVALQIPIPCPSPFPHPRAWGSTARLLSPGRGAPRLTSRRFVGVGRHHWFAPSRSQRRVLLLPPATAPKVQTFRRWRVDAAANACIVAAKASFGPCAIFGLLRATSVVEIGRPAGPARCASPLLWFRSVFGDRGR